MAKRVLIVDDSSDFLGAAKAVLEREGLSVVGLASTSAEGLQLATELRPDVVLVDIALGRESGFELARRLDREALRVILISTHGADDFADLIAESPAAGFVSKSELSAAAVRRLADSRPG